MNNATILMIEDNAAILRTNRMALESEGYRVLAAVTLTAGRILAEQASPDLILLDIILPDGSGLDYCREVFGQNAPRILFLTAMNTPEDVIAGLRAGGDDYMTKPYIIGELLARIESILRRLTMAKPEPHLLRVGLLELNATAGRVYLNGTDLLLSPMEFTVLVYLARNIERHVTAQELYEKLWGMDTAGDVRTVWEHISRLRSKLSNQSLVEIVSKRNSGYRLVTETADQTL
jgi:DNA-binding response OmpR family regulator